jgi:hypothetical protein
MSTYNINNLRFSSSSVDDFFGRPSRPSGLKTASSLIRIASVSQLAGFNITAEDRLIRVSQQDMWKLGHDDDGYYIERLVDDSNGPITGT